jgi:hypothetical protein
MESFKAKVQEIFDKIQEQMEKTKIYDFHLSGTTVLIYIITKTNIIEISLGDSGSFVFIQKEDGIYQVH